MPTTTDNILANLPAYYRALFNSAPFAIVIVDNSEHIMEWSPGAEALFGYTKTEALGKSAIKFLVPKDEQYAVSAVYDSVRNASGVRHNINRNITKSGKSIICEWTVATVKDPVGKVLGTISIGRETSDKLQAYESFKQKINERNDNLAGAYKRLKVEISKHRSTLRVLSESEKRYHQMTSLSPAGIYHLDAACHCTYRNSRCREILGILEMEKSVPWAKLIYPEDREKIYQYTTQAVQAHKSYQAEYRVLHGDGTVRWVYDRSEPIFDDSGLAGYVGTMIDITELRDTQEELQRRQEQLAHFSRVNAIGEMISGIAHEVNQPLAMIVNYTAGCLARLKQRDLPEDIIDTMTIVTEQAQRAGDIIHHLKEFLRKGELVRVKLDINTLIQDVMQFLSFVTKNDHVDVELELADNLPSVKLDKIQIEQVIVNLFNNAVDSMRESHSERKFIHIKTYQRNDWVYITVSDGGPGVPKEMQRSIFDPFFTTKESGMGVGLSISSSIVDLHGGKITLENDGDSQYFMISLPIDNEG